jgi:DNA-binding MarR family transcriptional regulator
LKRTSSTTPTLSTVKSPGLKLPVTATREILLSGGSDHALRTLLHDLFTIGNRLEEVRRYLGSCVGITGPQFTLMMAVLELQGATGVSVGKIAGYLHVAGTFVTAESAKLAHKGFLEKRTDPRDRRVSLLCVLPAGMKAIDTLLPELQQINDTFFDLESKEGFEALCNASDRLVEGSRAVLAMIRLNAVRSVGA